MAPRRAKDIWHVPNTDLVLTITHALDHPMTESAILQCLQRAATASSRDRPAGPVPTPWWSALPTGEAAFGIVPAVFHATLTWDDVFNVVQGLITYFETKEEWQGVNFYIKDSKRRTIGAGTLQDLGIRAEPHGGNQPATFRN